MKRAWLEFVDWQTIVAVNAALCQGGHALHKPSSEGYEETKVFWDENHQHELTLAETVELCRRCHRLAPFYNFNGNTFVAIIRDCIAHAEGFSPEQIALAGSLAGHVVAGTAEPGEIIDFNQLLHGIYRLHADSGGVLTRTRLKILGVEHNPLGCGDAQVGASPLSHVNQGGRLDLSGCGMFPVPTLDQIARVFPE